MPATVIMVPNGGRCWWCGAPGAAPLLAPLPPRLCAACGLKTLV